MSTSFIPEIGVQGSQEELFDLEHFGTGGLLLPKLFQGFYAGLQIGGECACPRRGIPLQARLLAQWLHHAYPRDCSFPHASGIINPLPQDEFTEQAGWNS